MRRGRSGGALLAAALTTAVLMMAVGCSSDDDAATTADNDATASTPAQPAEAEAPADPAPAGDDAGDDSGDAAAAPDREGTRIADDVTLRVPGEGGAAAVYEIRNLRVTEATTQTDCPGGSPVNAQRLAAEITAQLELPNRDDPNVTPNDQPLPVPYVSNLPEVVLIGVGADSSADAEWFVGVNPDTLLLTSVPNTVLRPPPVDALTSPTCAIEGWRPTDTPEPLPSAELEVTSDAFVPADFDPSRYQIRIGRGDDFAYCWPLDDLGATSELGQCR
jgi:hypothetical protein